MLCILSVFIPAFIMAEPVRSLFVPLSLAVGFAMITSYLLSSMLVPVLSVWLLKPHESGKAADKKHAQRNAQTAQKGEHPPQDDGDKSTQVEHARPNQSSGLGKAAAAPDRGAEEKPQEQHDHGGEHAHRETKKHEEQHDKEGEHNEPSDEDYSHEDINGKSAHEEQGFFGRVQEVFRRLVTASVAWRWVVVPAYAVTCAIVLGVVGLELGTELFPQIDSGEFVLRFRAPPGTNFELTRNYGCDVWKRSPSRSIPTMCSSRWDSPASRRQTTG